MRTLPTLFLSHGSPMHALEPGRAGEAWASLAARLTRPRAVLVASAHWESAWPMLASGERPETLHDFGGFPPELYRLRYAAPGAPEIAARAIALLDAAGIRASANACRGRDHGAWVPLRHLYPAADVPVAQVSIQPALPAAHSLEVGRALAPLAAEGVLVVGSGHLTHNLGEWMARAGRPASAAGGTALYVEEFRAWVEAALRDRDDTRITRWAEEAPQARRAHPSPEHFLPLPLAFGAAGPRPHIERIDCGVEGGVLAMDAYVFSPRG
ncbi:MAG: class III extradiol ring-cleavage dioxygenase [Rhodocyclaceae bacterium]